MSAIGLRVGPFEICDEVVVPGAGAWYRAARTGLTRRRPSEVLVRLLGPAPTTRELAAVQRQFDVLRAMDDPRFPRPVALYEGSGALAVDAPVGVSLERLVEARVLGDITMTPSTLLDLSLDLTEALAHAHGRGFHHGHLSSACVTIDPDGQLLVWGLGTAESRPPFSWLSPERARGEAATALTDQWSLGALIVSLVTGRTPWSPGSADVDPRSGVVDGFLEPLARQWPALGRLVRRLMDPNPTLRFPSLHPVRLELLALSRRAGGTSDRRSLAAWLHQEPEAADVPAAPPALAAAEVEAPVEVEVEVAPATPPGLADDLADTEPPAAVRMQAPRITVRSATVDPRDRPPEIQAVARVDGAGPAPASARLRPARALPAESMDIVRLDQVLDEVPVAAISARPPQGTRSDLPAVSGSHPVRIDADLAEEMLPTEMIEEDLPTEMATEMMEDDDPMVDVPPIRPRLSADVVRVELTDESLASLPGVTDHPDEAPVALRPSPGPSYGDQPVPTLPGMEVPEPSADRPVLAVQVQFDDDEYDDDDDIDESGYDDEDLDDLLVEDPMLDDLGPASGAVFDARLPAARAASVAVPVSLDELDEDELQVMPKPPAVAARRAAIPVAVSLDSFEDDLPSVDDASPSPTVVPFTDPHFAGPSLGLDMPMRPTRSTAPAERSEPDLGPAVFTATARWPWQRDDRAEPEPPEYDPVVRAAPWVASATVAALAVLLVVNILV